MAAGKEDIAPELLKKVQEDYRKRCENDKELARIEALAESGKANGKDTDAYAVRAGELLAAALHDNVSGDVLPDGRMYFNIASRVLPPVLRDNYELVAGMSTRIQQVLNDNAGLHMKALRPDLNEDRVKGLVNLAASADQYEDKRKELEADVVNFSQRISADGFHKNAEFQYTSGLNPKIRREAESGCCKWCQALEGTYDYADVRDTGNDVWRRHRDCKCVVEYDPGTGRRQNAHTKTWSQADDHRKKIEDAERMMEEREREQKRDTKNNTNKMAAEHTNDWSQTTTTMYTKAELRQLEAHIIERGYKVHNIKEFDGDIALLDKQLDCLDQMQRDFPLPVGRKITISIKDLGNDDFAETEFRTITFNTRALRNEEITVLNILNAPKYAEKEFQDIHENSIFAEKEFQDIARHEYGHAYEAGRSKYFGLEVATEAYYNIHGIHPSNSELVDTLVTEISNYAKTPGIDGRPCEIISEGLCRQKNDPNAFTDELFRIMRTKT